jgi:hypothetical protein
MEVGGVGGLESVEHGADEAGEAEGNGRPATTPRMVSYELSRRIKVAGSPIGEGTFVFGNGQSFWVVDSCGWVEELTC